MKATSLEPSRRRERRRRSEREGHDSRERWIVSYADFITLLFAFFVVMYAISTLNEGKYRVIIDKVLPLSQAPEAHRIVAERAGIGKVILRPTEQA